MNYENLLKLVNENEIEKIKTICIQQIEKSKIKNVSLFNARLKLSKLFFNQRNLRDALKGAYIYNSKQILCNGYYGGLYNIVYSGLFEIDKKIPFENLFNLENAFPPVNVDYGYVFSISKEKYEDLKKQYKILKTLSKKTCIRFKGSCYDIEYFFNLVDTFPLEDLTFYINTKVNNSTLVLISSIGKGLICPIRINDITSLSFIDFGC